MLFLSDIDYVCDGVASATETTILIIIIINVASKHIIIVMHFDLRLDLILSEFR